MWEKEFAGVKIGFIGLLLPETKQTSSMDDTLNVADFARPQKDSQRYAKKGKVIAVIALTHLSMAQDKQLAKCADIDLILGGHEHTLLQSSSNRTPIFKMTADAREMGKFNLTFDAATKQFVGLDWEIVPVTDKIADAPEFAQVYEK
ncbi:MAG: hypothetical protein IPK98_10975 [Chloracidobacterium sp.]|nr:hypothetical protein [Chloracidobacterium sp.]